MIGYTFYTTGSDPQHMGVTAVLEGDEPRTLGDLFAAHSTGRVDDVFDVTLYGNPEGDEEERRWYDESFSALEALVKLATVGAQVMARGGDPLIEAIQRIQRMQDELEVERKRAILQITWRDYEHGNENVWDWPEERVLAEWDAGDYEDLPEWTKSEDYETLDANEGEQSALSRVLDVLQLLAHGVTPAQGEAETC